MCVTKQNTNRHLVALLDSGGLDASDVRARGRLGHAVGLCSGENTVINIKPK